MALIMIQNYLTKNRCYQTAAINEKIGIQLHTIGIGQGTAQEVADYWNQSTVSACVHYIVDCDASGKVLQCLPEEYRSWADAGYGNNHLITFEICESDAIEYLDGASYKVLNETKFKEDIMRGYHTSVELCAKICKERGWNPQSKLPSGLYLISSHDEGRRAGLSSAHVDPTHIWERFGLTMDGFRADVAEKMKLELRAGMKVRLIRAIALRNGVSAKYQQAGYVKYTDLPASVKKKCKRIAGNRARLKAGAVVEIRDVEQTLDGTGWIQIKNGWLPVVVKGNYRVDRA